MSTTNDPEQLRDEIAATREELGDTVEALAAKTDVKAQAQHKVEEIKENVAQKRDAVADQVRSVTPETVYGAASDAGAEVRQNPVLTGAAFGAGLVLGLLIGRRSSED